MKRVFIQQLLTENTQSCVCFYLNAPVLKLSLCPVQSQMQRLHCPGCHDNSCHYDSHCVDVIGGRRTRTWREERGVAGMSAQSPWQQMDSNESN